MQRERERERGGRERSRTVPELQYVDDIVTFGSTSQNGQETADTFVRTYEEIGIELNVGKTEVLRIDRAPSHDIEIKIENDAVEEVQEFNYPGRTVMRDSLNTRDQHKWTAFVSNASVLGTSIEYMLTCLVGICDENGRHKASQAAVVRRTYRRWSTKTSQRPLSCCS